MISTPLWVDNFFALCPAALNGLSINKYGVNDLMYDGHCPYSAVQACRLGRPLTQGAYSGAKRRHCRAVASVGAVAQSSDSSASLSSENCSPGAGARAASAAQPLAQSMPKRWASSVPQMGTSEQRFGGGWWRCRRSLWGRSRA
ncbi:hypothetical protein B0H11DRAFT_2281802 [Mycena galericulata]|nr:hypothetical protein B0H11DRAFT_2281802 [Mycena galericulata]